MYRNIFILTSIVKNQSQKFNYEKYTYFSAVLRIRLRIVIRGFCIYIKKNTIRTKIIKKSRSGFRYPKHHNLDLMKRNKLKCKQLFFIQNIFYAILALKRKQMININIFHNNLFLFFRLKTLFLCSIAYTGILVSNFSALIQQN